MRPYHQIRYRLFLCSVKGITYPLLNVIKNILPADGITKLLKYFCLDFIMGILFHLSVYKWLRPTCLFRSDRLTFPGQKTPRTLIDPTFINFSYHSKVTRQRHIFHIFLKLYSVKWISNNYLYKMQCKLFYWFFKVLYCSMHFYNNKMGI